MRKPGLLQFCALFVVARTRSCARALNGICGCGVVCRMLEETLYHWSPAGGGTRASVPPHLFPESGPKARRRLDMEVGTADDAGVGAQKRQQASAPPGPAKLARNWKQQRSPRCPRFRRTSCGSGSKGRTSRGRTSPGRNTPDNFEIGAENQPRISRSRAGS